MEISIRKFAQITFFIFLFVLSSRSVFSADLEINNKTGKVEKIVTFSVLLNNIESDLRSIEFDILYDSNVLSLIDWTMVDLVSDFTFFNAAVNPYNKNIIKVAGTTANPIPKGSAGEVIKLNFMVNGCEGVMLDLSNLKGSIQGLSTKSGIFKCDTSNDNYGTFRKFQSNNMMRSKELAIVSAGIVVTNDNTACPNDGDVNGNGSVTIDDVKLAFDSIFKPESLSECQKDHADVDCKAGITIDDVSCLFDTLFGIDCICQNTVTTGFSVPAGYNFDINAGAVSIAEGLSNEGTLRLNNGTLIVGGNWTNSGQFSSDKGVVNLNSTTQPQSVLTGGGTSAFDTISITNFHASGVKFNDPLNCKILNAGSGVKKLSFATTGIHTVSSRFNVNGSSGDLITLGPTISSSDWNLDTPSTTVSFLNVNHSQEANGHVITADNSRDGGNNKNWVFTNSTASSLLPKTGLTAEQPTADFITKSSKIGDQYSAQFTDLSTGDPMEWLWNFGDGGTSIEQNPSHTYLIEGTFSVTLHVSNTLGEYSITKTNLITHKRKENKLFTIKCNRELHKRLSGVDKLALKFGEEEHCTLKLSQIEAGVPVEISTKLVSEGLPVINVYPFKGLADSNGELEFIITADSKGIHWLEWAVADDNGEFEFSKEVAGTGCDFGIWVEVE